MTKIINNLTKEQKDRFLKNEENRRKKLLGKRVHLLYEEATHHARNYLDIHKIPFKWEILPEGGIRFDVYCPNCKDVMIWRFEITSNKRRGGLAEFNSLTPNNWRELSEQHKKEGLSIESDLSFYLDGKGWMVEIVEEGNKNDEPSPPDDNWRSVLSGNELRIVDAWISCNMDKAETAKETSTSKPHVGNILSKARTKVRKAFNDDVCRRYLPTDKQHT